MPQPSQFHIHFRGQVQGVGFRPLVYNLMQHRGWPGWISNGKDGVHLMVAAEVEAVDRLIEDIRSQLPAYAIITDITIDTTKEALPRPFEIRPSDPDAAPDLLITPDRAMCPDCRKELYEAPDRRQGYAFTTCLHCGPRYSIIRQLPYDRERTTMASFPLCAACAQEVQDPLDRRHYSQTNSCPDCAISLRWEDGRNGERTSDPDIVIARAVEALQLGQILAVKGLGGYLLLADARNGSTIRELRRRKHRPDKPLALMYPSLEDLSRHVTVREEAIHHLTSPASPILLLPWKEAARQELPLEDIAPGLCDIGVMQPNTPLFDLILRGFGHPVIATSGNISGAPILIHEEEARQGLASIADHFIHNDRDMVAPQDDSVFRLVNDSPTPLIIRRSRGLAPAYMHLAFGDWQAEVLALGAHMKGALAIQHRDTTHISQYLGNLESYEARQNYQQVAAQLLGLLEANPELILTDAHPGYFTSQWGHELAGSWGIPLQRYPHHVAHFAALLAEHERLDAPEPILGVIWDGSGLGSDGTIWGGEFFLRHDGRYERMAHLQPFPLLLGDKMAREPRLSALSICRNQEASESLLRDAFTEQEWMLYRRMVRKGDQMLTSSMGRLFDGVAALTGCADRQSFEGQAAMYLETLARSTRRGAPYPLTFPTRGGIGYQELTGCILDDLLAGRPRGEIAASFLHTLVRMIEQVAQSAGVRVIGLSGGVWQNALLTGMVEQTLGDRYTILRHHALSPNDENIPLGQLALLWQERHDAYLPVTESTPSSNSPETC